MIDPVLATHRGRILAMDGDAALLAALAGEAGKGGWEFDGRVRAIDPGALLTLKLQAVLIDPVTIGPRGWGLVAEARELAELPLVVCSERVSRERRVSGLRDGVDDWITKPMDPVEIVARIEAVVRSGRTPSVRVDEAMEFGELLIEPRYRQARIHGENLALTLRELDLLIAMARRHGTVVEREALYRQAWGYSMPPGDRSVDVFVAKLRQKLERRSIRFTYIHTHYAVGYRFEPVADEVDPRWPSAGRTGERAPLVLS
jgi:DNA-binding response OmpR family regulator